MNCWSKYSYYDYEEAYFKMQYYKCKEIGIYLLEKLKKFEYDWLHQDTKDAQLLWDIKVWLMVNDW